MNPQGPDPQMAKAQAEEQLRVITFLRDQKERLMLANSAMVNSLAQHVQDLSTIFPVQVINAYLNLTKVQNTQLEWEIENLERDMGKLQEFVTQVEAQLNSRILRVMPTPMPPTGPRNIR